MLRYARQVKLKREAEKMRTCIYQMTWTDKVTGEKSIHTCGDEIDFTKIPPYRQGHGVCHRHERGLAGWNPSNCKGVCCAPFPQAAEEQFIGL